MHVEVWVPLLHDFFPLILGPGFVNLPHLKESSGKVRFIRKPFQMEAITEEIKN